MAYYRGATGAIICYDTTEAQTLKNAERWIKDFRERSNPNTPVVLVACKADLLETEDENLDFAPVLEEENGENIL